jgi:hypothetical protein
MMALAGGHHFVISPVVVAAEVAIVLFMHVFIRRLDASEFSILLFYCCMLHYYISRADQAHFRFLPIVAALLMPFLLLTRKAPDGGRIESETSMGTALAIFAASAFVVVATPEFRPGLSVFPNGLALISNALLDGYSTDGARILGSVPPSRAWDTVYPDDKELAALRYVRERTDGTTPLFVGYRDHSRIFWNDLRMYWLADRPIAVRTFQLETRMATEAPVQHEIITDLENNKNTWVILDSEPEGDEAFFRAQYQGARLLDEYIGQHFKQVAAFGRYLVLTRASD